MAVRIEKIVATVLHEAHERQTEEVMYILSEGLEGLWPIIAFRRRFRPIAEGSK